MRSKDHVHEDAAPGLSRQRVLPSMRIAYVGPIPDISYYGVDEMRVVERNEFLVWYESQRSETFDNRHVLESYSQNGVTVLRQACRLFRREFMQIGHIDIFVESITIASACNKVLRKRFLKPDNIGLILMGGYTSNYSVMRSLLLNVHLLYCCLTPSYYCLFVWRLSAFCIVH